MSQVMHVSIRNLVLITSSKMYLVIHTLCLFAIFDTYIEHHCFVQCHFGTASRNAPLTNRKPWRVKSYLENRKEVIEFSACFRSLDVSRLYASFVHLHFTQIVRAAIKINSDSLIFTYNCIFQLYSLSIKG